MTAVRESFQGAGVGARLKWAQRERALSEGVRFVKWTFEPVKARNAYFNLEKLGAVVREFRENFYGTDYATSPEQSEKIGLASDRLFAEWELDTPKVRALASGEPFEERLPVAMSINIPSDWSKLVGVDVRAALAEQLRVRSEFEAAFSRGLVCRGFQRNEYGPRFLLYAD
jgi:predicted GNAT superfamily acetyltransferase